MTSHSRRLFILLMLVLFVAVGQAEYVTDVKDVAG